ncbi:MAG: carboxyltransferase domain-containing protein [Rhodobacteraceae bacterium]|nr:MAG: carboxyltransferase domain-containing protein [Paracoccaceae bacterium]
MTAPDVPIIRTVGLDGMLVSFGDRLSEPANRAALALRAALDREGWPGVEETSTSLVSAFLRFDPRRLSHEALRARLADILEGRDWTQADLPEGRRLFRIPTVYGTDLAPQLDEAAHRAGISPGQAVAELSSARVRVQTIGFAPGQPYLGALPPHWDIPRQQGLTPRVPEGALVVAIRQFVLFSVATPTGWRHVGQTAARLFRPEAPDPFLLRPGDEVEFPSVTREEFDNFKRRRQDGIRMEPLP